MSKTLEQILYDTYVEWHKSLYDSEPLTLEEMKEETSIMIYGKAMKEYAKAKLEEVNQWNPVHPHLVPSTNKEEIIKSIESD